MDRSRVQWRRSLFLKYLVVLFIVVVVPLLANGISEAWFGYRDQRAMLNASRKLLKCGWKIHLPV